MTALKQILLSLIIFTLVECKLDKRRKLLVDDYHSYLRRNEMMSMCDGEENLKSDIGILSFFLGVMSSSSGLFSLSKFSVPSNNIGIISTILSLVLWIPSALLTLFAASDPFSYVFGNLINIASLIVTFYGGFSVIPGTVDIILSTMDEMVGVVSLWLSSLTTFPEMYNELKEVFQQVFGKENVDTWIGRYGCSAEAVDDLDLFRDMIFG